MARRDRMRLGAFLYPGGHHVAAWRHPSSDADAGINAAHYRQIARTAEAAKFDLIFLADTKCCGQDASTVAERPGWSEMSAVQQGNVVELDDDIASRWGPRIVDFLEAIVEATADVDAGVAG